MSFPAYPSYRGSGVEWLGEVPSAWAIERLRTRANLITAKAEAQTRPIALENIEGWSGKLITSDTEFQNDGVAFEEGDILFGKLRPYLAKVYVAQFSGQAVGDFHVIRPTASVDAKFLAFCLLTRELISLIDGSTYGAKMPRASWDFIREVRFVFPSLAEQVAIAAFLDHETAKIDALIEEQRRLIALLKEKRQAVISHAVTKGLDPHAPMKDSGIGWLGKVPAHWEVCKLGFHAKLQSGYAFSSTDFGTDGVPLVRMNNLARGKIDLSGAVCIPEKAINERVSLSEGDLVWGMSGSIGETGSLGNFARVAAADLPCQLNQRVGRFLPVGGLTIDYLEFVIQSDAFQQQTILFVTGTAQFNVSGEQVQSILVAIPPAAEQTEIRAFLRERQYRYDLLINEAKRSIEFLNERRGALISAAVTGKIDVRGAAATEQEREAA